MKPTSVLLIDDDLDMHRAMRTHLAGVVDVILTTVLAGEGVQMAAERQPDLVLLYDDLPVTDGFAVCRALKKGRTTRDIPVMFLSNDGRPHRIAKALDTGATGYVTKPFQPIELQAHVRAALRTKRLVDLLKEHSQVDAATGLGNRRAFGSAVRAITSLNRRHGQRFAVVMLCLDGFQSVNKEYGYGIGDEVLGRVGKAVAGNCRPADVACRYAGGTLVLGLPLATQGGARVTAERHLASIRTIVVPVGDRAIRVSASAGVAAAPASAGENAGSRTVAEAEAALHEAQQQGPNSVVVAPDLDPAPSAPDSGERPR